MDIKVIHSKLSKAQIGAFFVDTIMPEEFNYWDSYTSFSAYPKELWFYISEGIDKKRKLFQLTNRLNSSPRVRRTVIFQLTFTNH